MQPMRIFYCLVILAISTDLLAQDNKVQFHSANSGGIAMGGSGVFGLAQSVNGLEYKKWFTGIGVGYDAYYYKSFPVFGDVRRFLDNGKRLLIYGDLGYGLTGKNSPKETSYYSSFHFYGGLYCDAGVGYSIRLVKNKSFLISGGYSYKKVSNKITQTICGVIAPCYESVYRYEYSLNRVVFKAGVVL